MDKTKPTETLPTKEEKPVEDIVSIAKKRMQLSQEYCQPYFDRFLDNYKHYFIRTIDEAIEEDPEAYPFYSNLMLPITYQTVETVLPRVFSKLPTFNIKTEQSNDEKAELGLKELIRYQMNHPYLIDDPIYARLLGSLKEEFITGNAWAEVPWYHKEEDVIEWQPYAPELGINEPSWDNLEPIQSFGVKPQWKLVKVRKTMMDAPVYQHKSVFHVFPDPKKKRVSDMGWGFTEEFMTKDEIMTMANAAPRYFKNMDQFQALQPEASGSNNSKQVNYDEEIASMFDSKDYTFKDTTQGQYKVWFMKERGRLSIFINETLCIRDGDNPNGDGKLGLILMKDIPIPGELFAWGEPDPIKRIEDSMSDQANMRQDNVFYDLMRMWKLNPESLVDGEEFIPEPGTVVQMNDMNGLQPLETGSTKPTAYREYNEWEKMIQNVSGVSDYATGQADPSMNKTSSGVEMLQQAANARFMQKLNLFENLGLKAIGTMYVNRNMRFFDTPQPLNTEKGRLVAHPDDIRMIRGNIHFMVDSGSSEAISRETEIKKWQGLVGMIGKPPFDNLTENAKDQWGRRLLYSLNETDVETLMEKNQPVAPDALTALENGGTTENPGGTPPVANPTAPAQTVAQPPANPTQPIQPTPATPAVVPAQHA